MTDPARVQWLQEWNRLLLRYPNARPESGQVDAYWEDLCKFPADVIREGVAMARADSPKWFPTAPSIVEQCKLVEYHRQQRMPALPASAGPSTGEYGERAFREATRVASALRYLLEQDRLDLLQAVANDETVLEAARGAGWRDEGHDKGGER
jgi:hypothetical protein